MRPSFPIPVFICVCVFGFCWFIDGCPRAVLLVLSLLVDAGCNVGNIASCDFDVGDVDVAELEEMR